jgi:hypothetical protein
MVNDIAETKDVSKENPLVVKQYLTQITKEAKKYGVASIHLPLDIKSAKPQPSGKVLAIDISAEADLKKLTIKILKKEISILADQYLEYDIKVDSTSELSYCNFSPIRGTNGTFNDKMGIDLTGKPVQSPTVFNNNWKHVSVGLCSYSPLIYGEFGLTYKFKKSAKTTIYLDNIRIKNTKGNVVYDVFTNDLDKSNIRSPKVSIVELK